MIELVCLGILLPIKVRKLAAARGERALRWWLRGMLAWLAVQVFAFCLLFSGLLLSYLLKLWPKDETDLEAGLIVYYLIATIVGIMVAEKVATGRLRSMAIAPSSENR